MCGSDNLGVLSYCGSQILGVLDSVLLFDWDISEQRNAVETLPTHDTLLGGGKHDHVWQRRVAYGNFSSGRSVKGAAANNLVV